MNTENYTLRFHDPLLLYIGKKLIIQTISIEK